jgi:hypothetical protein
MYVIAVLHLADRSYDVIARKETRDHAYYHASLQKEHTYLAVYEEADEHPTDVLLVDRGTKDEENVYLYIDEIHELPLRCVGVVDLSTWRSCSQDSSLTAHESDTQSTADSCRAVPVW